MRKLLLLLSLLIPSICLGQGGIIVPGTASPFITLSRGVTWTGFGAGTINNNWTLTLNPATAGACLYIQQDPFDGNAHSATMSIWQTGDPLAEQKGFVTGNGAWSAITVNQGVQIAAGITQPFTYWIPYNSAAGIAIIFTAGTGAGTADLLLVQGGQQYCGQGTQTQGFTQAPFVCNSSATVNVATATTSTIASGVVGANIRICSWTITIAGATVTAAVNNFLYGTGATCAGSSSVAAAIKNGASTFALSQNIGNGELYGGAWRALTTQSVPVNFCYTDGGTTAGSNVTVSYAIF